MSVNVLAAHPSPQRTLICKGSLSVVAIASLLVVLLISMLITRVGAMALQLTGMSREASSFQARSAFTGVGFTTREAEDVISHPVRRRIVMLLMLLSNLGVGAVVATLMLSFMQASAEEGRGQKLLVLAIGLCVVFAVSRSKWIERQVNRIIAWGLLHWSSLPVRDYVAILQLESGFAVTELVVEKGDWLAEQSILDLKLPDEGVLILGIRRKEGAYLGTPTPDMVIHADDALVLYGPTERIEELDQRRRGARGDAAHQEAVEEHEVELEEQEKIDPDSRTSATSGARSRRR